MTNKFNEVKRLLHCGIETCVTLLAIRENINFNSKTLAMKTWLTAFAAVSCQINEECVSIDNGKLCEDDCIDVCAQCVVNCGSDSNCVVQCNRDLAICSSNCPCHSNCEKGCPCDYESIYCNDCKLDEFNQEQYTKCSNLAAQNLSSCNQKCDVFDDACLDKCAEQFHNDIRDCPCMDNCADGCPCSSYECDQIDPPTTDPPAIINTDVSLLVFDGKYNLNKFTMQFRPPMVFDEVNIVDNFDLDESFVDFYATSTCSVFFQLTNANYCWRKYWLQNGNLAYS